MVKGYWNTKDICARFRWSSTTLYRRQRLKHNPFPEPTFYQKGAANLWAIDDVLEWEEKEKAAKAA